MVDYLNDLRESILSAYSGIIQGMTTEKTVSPMEAHIPYILEFIKTVAIDNDINDDVTCACVALIGLVDIFLIL